MSIYTERGHSLSQQRTHPSKNEWVSPDPQTVKAKIAQILREQVTPEKVIKMAKKPYSVTEIEDRLARYYALMDQSIDIITDPGKIYPSVDEIPVVSGFERMGCTRPVIELFAKAAGYNYTIDPRLSKRTTGPGDTLIWEETYSPLPNIPVIKGAHDSNWSLCIGESCNLSPQPVQVEFGRRTIELQTGDSFQKLTFLKR